jgi:hypothetical protein
MFSVSLHLSGRPDSMDVPFAAGPLHCGQLSARTAETNPTDRISAAENFAFMGDIVAVLRASCFR